MLPVIAFRGARLALGPLLFDYPGEHRQLGYSGRFETIEAHLRTSPGFLLKYWVFASSCRGRHNL